jgi:diguanylate cyclase (GGDEF)-like protein
MHRLAVQRATLDGLTQLGNHRVFQDELSHAAARAGRHGEALSPLLFDLDDFKQANDRHGHRHGDELLRRVARCCAAAARATAPSGSAATSSPCCSRAPASRAP